MAEPNPQAFEGSKSLSSTNPTIHVSLTHAPLDVSATMALVKSPKAGAVVLFVGTHIPQFYTPYLPIRRD